MLVLAGAGLHRGHFTLELLEALREADVVYFEGYTMPRGVASSVLRGLMEHAQGKVVVARRSDIEEGSLRIVKEAMRRRVVVVSAGHPLIATTHTALLAEASRHGVGFKVVHGVSGIVAAMTESGLDFYKFGRKATVPGPWRGVRPFSTLEFLYGNLCVGLHTLLILDLADDGRQLSPQEASSTLINAEKELIRSNSISHELIPSLEAIVVSGAGTETAKVAYYGELADLARETSNFEPPTSIVVPGEVSGYEADFVRALYGVEVSGISEREREEACENYSRLRRLLRSGP